MNPSVTHATVYFTGHVQGVGFRYTALQVAKEYEVAGRVQNLTDGRVALEAEGRAATVDAFITALQDRMHGYVKKIERVQQTRAPQFRGFEIR